MHFVTHHEAFIEGLIYREVLCVSGDPDTVEAARACYHRLIESPGTRFDRRLLVQRLIRSQSEQYGSVVYSGGDESALGSVLEGLSVEVTENPVTDETVSEELERLRCSAAVYVASEDGTFEEHDALVFTYSVSEWNGFVVENVTEERYSEELARDFPDDVVKALVGAAKGDSVSVEGVEVPHGDHTHKHNYLVNIHELKKRSLPELDDEFAKGVSEGFESLDALKAHIRKSWEEAEKNRKRAETLNEIYTELDKRVEFDPPDSMVWRLVSRSIQRAEQNLAQYGVTPQQLGRRKVDHYIEQAMFHGRRSAKKLLIADQIGRLWGVEASEEDVQKELDRIAEAQGGKALAIRADLEKNNQFEDFKADLRIRAVNDRLIDHAEVKVVDYANWWGDY